MIARNDSIVLQIIATAVLVLVAGCGQGYSPVTGDESQRSRSQASAWEDAYQERQRAGKSDTPECSGVVPPDRGGFDKQIALTFDDGPHPQYTPEVLEVLERHDVPAAFFVTGESARAAPDILERVIEEGHIVGNHSYSHRDLGRASGTATDRELARTHEAIAEHETSIGYMRFPYGSADCDDIEIAENFGYKVTGWHIDSADWCFGSGSNGYCSESTWPHMPDSMRGNMEEYVLSQARDTQGGIALFHDIQSVTANRLDSMISRLKQEGFEFVRLDNREVFPKLNRAEQLDQYAWTGDACGQSASNRGDEYCSYASNSYCHRFGSDADSTEESDASSSEGFCTVSCEGLCEDMPGKATTFCVDFDADGSGECVSKSKPENGYCERIPGTEAVEAPRFVGDSDAPDATDTVCLPEG